MAFLISSFSKIKSSSFYLGRKQQGVKALLCWQQYYKRLSIQIWWNGRCMLRSQTHFIRDPNSQFGAFTVNAETPDHELLECKWTQCRAYIYWIKLQLLDNVTKPYRSLHSLFRSLIKMKWLIPLLSFNCTSIPDSHQACQQRNRGRVVRLVWRNLREGRESEESAAITKACPSRKEEPLKRKWEEPRFGSRRTSCVHNLSLDLGSALPTRHNHCSCQRQKILQTLKHGGSKYLQQFGLFLLLGDRWIVSKA